MHSRYLISIGRGGDEPLRRPDGHIESLEVGEFTATIMWPDGRAAPGLSCELGSEGHRLTITEGSPISLQSDSRPLHTGSYIQIVIDALAGDVSVANDVIGVLPCYVTRQNDTVLISNSVRLARDYAGLAIDELGIAQRYLLSYGIAERTIVRDLSWLAPGSEMRIDLNSRRPPQQRRLTTAWTTVIDDSLENIIIRVIELWNASIERHLGGLGAPVGLMLSGGLDSRLVAGALVRQGREGPWITHGNLLSDEAQIAVSVADLCQVPLLMNGLDSSFPFDRLSLTSLSQTVEAIVNPIWDSSARLLAEHGVAHFATGAGFDEFFGVRIDSEPRRRLMKNLRHSVIGPSKPRPVTVAGMRTLTDMIVASARKRQQHYTKLLAEPYRTMIVSSMPSIEAEVLGRLESLAGAPAITLEQMHERYAFEHLIRQWTAVQERQLRAYGEVLLPTYDRDLVEYLSNLPPGVKYDHYLYYRVFRRLYPELARLRVPNLGTSIDRPQLSIELTRALRLAMHRRPSTWVNFDRWMRGGRRMDQYEELFLANDHFFNSDAVREHFGGLRDRRYSLYDGNEMHNYLNLGMLLQAVA